MTKELKNSAVYKNFVIEQFEDNTIDIKYRTGKRREALREISNELGFEYNSNWNTQILGHKLIDFINNMKTTQ